MRALCCDEKRSLVFICSAPRGSTGATAEMVGPRGIFARLLSAWLLLAAAYPAGTSSVIAKLSDQKGCSDASRKAVDEIQETGEALITAGKVAMLVPNQDASCTRGYSNQIDCFARVVLLAKSSGAILVLDRFRFWSAPYQHGKDGKRLEPLVRPEPFPNHEAPPPAVEFGLWWDVDYFIEEIHCRTGIIVLKKIPEGVTLPAPRCIQVRDVTGRQLRTHTTLGCWQKQNFIGVAALHLKKNTLASLKPSSFVRHFSGKIVEGLRELAPTYVAIHLRLEADAVAGGISRPIDPQHVLKLLAKDHKLPNTTVLYVAAGGFKGKEQVMKEWGKRFVLRTKEIFVPEINTVLPERELRAAVEFDVLRSSQILFGHSCSSMSTIATQVRCFSALSQSSTAYYFDEHNTKSSQPKCGESIWNGKMAVRLHEKAPKPFKFIGNLAGSGLRKVPCVPRSKI